jgi:uncharacterized phage protein (TIGR01671 family)
MREILFRGKRTEDGEWMCGNLTIWSDKSASIDKEPTEASPLYAVVPETVGQYTGLTDKNGKQIFEGDIVTGLFLFALPVKAVVTFQDGAFGLEWYRGGDLRAFNAFTSVCNVEYEVIGNIHDNPELLKGGAE